VSDTHRPRGSNVAIEVVLPGTARTVEPRRCDRNRTQAFYDRDTVSRHPTTSPPGRDRVVTHVLFRDQWRFIKGPEARGMELVVINPGFVVGPTLSGHRGTSVDLCTRFLKCQYPAVLGVFPPAK
jgi:hypothetical protein